MPASAAAFRRARGKGHRFAARESGRTAHAGRNWPRGRLQSILFEPDLFDGNRHDHAAIHPSAPHGTRGGIAAGWQIKCHGSGDGSRLFQPQPFRPGVSRNIWLLPRTLPTANPFPKTAAHGADTALSLSSFRCFRQTCREVMGKDGLRRLLFVLIFSTWLRRRRVSSCICPGLCQSLLSRICRKV